MRTRTAVLLLLVLLVMLIPLAATPPLPMPYAPWWLPWIGSVHQPLKDPFSIDGPGDMTGIRIDVTFTDGNTIACFWPLVTINCDNRFNITLIRYDRSVNQFRVTALNPQPEGVISSIDLLATTWYLFNGRVRLLGRLALDNQLPGDNTIGSGIGTFGSGNGSSYNDTAAFHLILLDRFSEDLYGRLRIEPTEPANEITFLTDLDVMWRGGTPPRTDALTDADTDTLSMAEKQRLNLIYQPKRPNQIRNQHQP